MEQTVHAAVKKPGTAAQGSRPPLHRQIPPGREAGRLANLASVMTQSPKVQAQLKLAAEIHNGRPVQSQRMLASELNHAQPPVAQLQMEEMDQVESDTPEMEKAPPVTTPVVQRFRALGKEEYKQVRQNDDGSHFFTKQSVDPELKESLEGTFSIEHDVASTNAKRNLNVADDGTMAINNTASQAKEFYAADSVFDHSVSTLKDANSLIKLVRGSGLSLEAGGQALHKVTPAPAQDEGEQQAGQFASLVADICIEMASGVMGNIPNDFKHEVVFQSPGSKDQRVANIESAPDVGDPKINRLASALSGQVEERGIDQVRAAIDKDGSQPNLPGKTYGELSGGGQLDKTESDLGINKYAQPEVGEGFATFSVSGHADKPIDYATGGPAIERLGHVWGYHFAGVVARSADGADFVTLENYNRRIAITKQLRLLLQRLVGENREKFEQSRKGIEAVIPADTDRSSQIQAKLTDALEVLRHPNPEDAARAYSRLLNAEAFNQAWFFKMYGSGHGQSYHEQQAASGTFVNPLTLRVRRPDPKREQIRSKCEEKLILYPHLPGEMGKATEFSDFTKIKQFHLKRLADAETLDLIQQAYAEGLATVAAYLIDRSAATTVRLARQHGANVADALAQATTLIQSIKKKAAKAQLVAETCHQALEEKIQGLWISQVEEKLAMVKSSFTIHEAWSYIPSVEDHYQSNK